MIAIDINRIKVVQEKFRIEIIGQHNEALKKLNELAPSSTADCIYLYETIELFKNESDFLLKSPLDIELLIPSLPAVPLVEKKVKNKIEIVKSSIKNEILKALNYTKLRSDFYPAYFKEIGIKACVYCNSSLTVSVDRIDNEGRDEVRAKFQVDHYYPKSEFPMLSISLFNLYPSCASCNNVKLEKKVQFHLYSDDQHLIDNSSFSFKLSSYDEAKYLLDKKNKDIDFDFIENSNLPEGFSSFQATFDIKGIYSTQNDLILDLIDKSLIYDFHYKKSLNHSFPKLFLSKEHFERIILGNYPRVQDIHKRPMSKFMQDIARDLGIIDY
ncbi:hypothetical protein Fluta_2985 [Fluviicola taffensis DSM 16823]|uniref:HNH endonuclease n=2 Tax=Fluviicola TaxID=332102 RepID=F2IJ94_FLUTR|nr:hypothetical protein Fluta_2985 [Fluviicola taffensis DSM 16823]